MKFVLITGASASPESLIGSYGILHEYAYNDKWFVEVKGQVGKTGSFKHTVHKDDFNVIEVYGPDQEIGKAFRMANQEDVLYKFREIGKEYVFNIKRLLTWFRGR